MAHFFSASDFDPGLIQSTKVGMLGYGNQGSAQALNLRDSGVSVLVGLYEGSRSAVKATEEGFEVVTVAEATQRSELLVFCLPDVPMAQIYRQSVAPYLRPGQSLAFAHGFNVHFSLIQPPADVNVMLISPKGAGYGVRSEYVRGAGVPALVGVQQDATGSALSLALSYAWGLGCARSVVVGTTFREETVSDLSGEQAVLCGGMIELIKAGFSTLVEAGYEPEAAYFECLHETKLIIDLLVARGLTGMREAISDTAEWGGYLTGKRLITETTRATMRDVLHEIEDGSFAKKWVEESSQGAPNLKRLRAEESGHLAEQVGRRLRPLMPD